MAQSTLKIGFRRDPDLADLAATMHRLIRDAYDRGAISWERRLTMLDSVLSHVELQNYDVWGDDPNHVTVCVFGEPSPAFLAEIGLPLLTP